MERTLYTQMAIYLVNNMKIRFLFYNNRKYKHTHANTLSLSVSKLTDSFEILKY